MLETLLGTNYRMDHMPDLMTADKGDDGHYLHGGNYEAFGANNSCLACVNIDKATCIVSARLVVDSRNCSLFRTVGHSIAWF